MAGGASATRVLVRRIQASLRGGALDEGAALLRDLRELEPLAVHTRAGELELLVHSARTSEALTLAEQLEKLHPTSPRILFWAGRAAIAGRRHERAIAALRESLRLARRAETERWLARALLYAARFDEAEPILLSVVQVRPRARLDLALLYERRGDLPAALRVVEELHRELPQDARAKRERVRLRAACAAPTELVRELEELEGVGEAIPPELLAPYLEALLATGAAARARDVALRVLPELSPYQATQLAWAAHHHDAFDLSFALFCHVLPGRLDDKKLRAALEKAASQAGRLPSLADLYAELSKRDPRLSGMVTRLRKRAEKNASA